MCALLSVTHDWFADFECGREVCAVFFDYHKAFDRVSHLPLLEKLGNPHFNSSNLEWVTDYLTGCSQNVVVNGNSSWSASVISGVPRRKRFSDSSKSNSITINPVLQCFSYIFLWLGSILIMLHLSGHLTRKRTKHYWRTFRSLLSIWPV